MSDIKQIGFIVLLTMTVSACQTNGLNPFARTAENEQGKTVEASPPDLAKLVSEELVLAAAMPVTRDGLDDIVERTIDPPPIEPAEADEPEAISDLWERIRQGFVLDHHLDNARVRSEINWYKRHPDYIDRVATRATRYMYQIVNEIESRQLPMELALLPVVESAFDPFAYSHGKASGLWQFIPSTGRLFGLKIDYWYDGRRDVVEATNAALRYLSTSQQSLNGDWLLALAAYNTGEGNVRYSMRKNTRAGKPIDFFSLQLFRETRAYVPRLLAISEIIAHPAKYGITLKPIANEPYFVAIDTQSQIDLTKAAELAEISVEELYMLNPAFNKWSTHPMGPHQLLIPVNNAELFRKNLAATPPDQRISWKRHKVKNGESLGIIAKKYHTTIATIRRANNIRGSLIVTGSSLLIPVASYSAEQYPLSDSERLKSTQAYVEKKLGTVPVIHTVRSGDNLWDLSREYSVSMRSLAKWNGMATTEVLYPGRELKIFTTAAQYQNIAALPNQNLIIRKVNYRVRRGESLSKIADKFNLSVNNIKKWNKGISSQKYIQPGDKITLYVDVTQTD